uniref:Uncharacterized protein n=1 Tax=Faecalibaculum rodentium TaxID=1702221 RepID=A0A140DRG2_9FIRM|nr:hypothetical protein AALO17_01050 [Faecalibaculum rodentium]
MAFLTFMFVCNPFQIHIVSGYRKVRGKMKKSGLFRFLCFDLPFSLTV